MRQVYKYPNLIRFARRGQRLSQPRFPPPVEKPLNRRERRKLLAQPPPLTTGRVEQCVDHLAHRGRALSPQLVRGRDKA